MKIKESLRTIEVKLTIKDIQKAIRILVARELIKKGDIGDRAVDIVVTSPLIGNGCDIRYVATICDLEDALYLEY